MNWLGSEGRAWGQGQGHNKVIHLSELLQRAEAFISAWASKYHLVADAEVTELCPVALRYNLLQSLVPTASINTLSHLA